MHAIQCSLHLDKPQKMEFIPSMFLYFRFSPGKGQITHKNDGDELGNLLLETTAPSVGQAVNFGGATVENTREYAIGLQVAQSKL